MGEEILVGEILKMDTPLNYFSNHEKKSYPKVCDCNAMIIEIN
jgi:hypothetical protein